MTHSQVNTFLEDVTRNEQFLTHSGVRDVRGSGLSCRARVGGDPTIKPRAALVHTRCAVSRPRLVR